MIRTPAVSGQFYPSEPKTLSRMVDTYTGHAEIKTHAIGAVSPHAGLMYSGHVAGAVYSQIIPARTFILIGPNHTGMGSAVSIMSSGQWQMPTGEVSIDAALAEKIKEGSDIINENSEAHVMEHSLEVQLPFIIQLFPGSDIVPIIMMTESVETCREVGKAVAGAIKASDYPVTIIASSDMSHYVSKAVAREKDEKAIRKIVEMDPKGLLETVMSEGISMCGVAPVTAMLFAAKDLGAKESVLVKYMTSGDVSGDYKQVVGYAGLIVK